uniref:MFS domain-containing protein n=1 Tax=Globodera pallida TaxID=36090 RepID=A0A183BI45_GLOPA
MLVNERKKHLHRVITKFVCSPDRSSIFSEMALSESAIHPIKEKTHEKEDVLPVLVLNSSHVVPPTVPYSAREKSMLLYAISSTQSLGWPWVFYAHAMVAPLLFGLWLLFYTDFPESHKFVGLRERAVISQGKTSAETAITGFVPYRAILKNKVVLVVWLNSFADIVTIVFITTYMPVYVAKVLRYGVRETGIWSALPGLVQLPLRPVLGIASDRLRCISEMNKMRVFNSVALVGSALCFALVGFVPENLPMLAVIIMTINTASTAANTGGLYKCGTFVSRQYAHFVVAGIQFEKSVTLFVSPLLFSFFITDESSVVQWRAVFLGMFVILTMANAFFLFMVTDQPADFTNLRLMEGEERIQTK